MKNNSRKLFERSLDFLPFGTSTLSKAPRENSSEPALIVRGKGCRVWDADENEYIDFKNGLGPVTLGYSFPEINDAIIRQLEDGVVFGYPHPLEGETAEMLVGILPCAQKARFLKTGGEAVAACVKLARLYTGRNIILHCGYNGWLNNFGVAGFRPAGISQSRPLKGIPEQVSCLHIPVPWGNLKAWEAIFNKNGGDIAAVVIACDLERIEAGQKFLPEVRRITEESGAVMVLDEIITGFRLAFGGAHEYFSFKPDLAVFSKGIANGMPLSAYVGRDEIMRLVKEAGISSTFGGEALSLAAAKAVISFYREKNVIGRLWDTGSFFQEKVNRLFAEYDFPARLCGLPVCPVFKFDASEDRNAFFDACFRRGVSLYDVLFVNYSHKNSDIEEAVWRIEGALKDIGG